MIDISRMMDANLEIFPGDPPLVIQTLVTTPYCLSHVAFGTHTGTHVDAPAHFIPDGMKFPDIPLERLNGPCWVVDGLEWPSCERVLIKQPHVDVATAQRLVDSGVKLVGINSQSIERDVEGTFPVHHVLLGNDVLLLEGLDLQGVEPGPYDLVCLPMKLDVPDGGPVRAVLRPR